MSENLHDIDKLFKDSIDGHEDMPSEKVWDTIDNNLDKNNVIQIKRKYNNLKRLAIALLLLLLGTIVYEIQSKKTGKAELVKNGINSIPKKDSTGNTTAGKTKPGGEGNKSNGSGDDQNKITATSSNNTLMNNAGKDAGKDAEKDSLSKTIAKGEQQQKITITGQQKSNTKVAIKNPKMEEEETVANENAQMQQNNKSLIKKSSHHKTKISIKNGVAEEDIVANENNGISKSPTSPATTELKAPQNDKAEKIVVAQQKGIPEKIESKRNSPDASTAIAKNKTLKSPKPFHFTVMPFYAPQYSFNRLEDDHHDPGQQPGNGRDAIKKDEPHEKVSSFGILVAVPLGKKWSLQSGITYLDKEINIEPKKIYAKLDNDGKVKYRFDCSSGYTYISPKTGTTPAVGDSISAAASTNILQYLGIPLAVNYTFSLGKFSVIPTVGTTINFLTKQKIETELIQGTSNEKQSISTIEGLKKTYFSAFTGIALEYNVNKRIALNITPSGNFALSSINKNAAVKSYPNTFGVAAGIKIKF